MLFNYFITALRNMRRRLGFTLVNVLGLALGIASCLLIFLVVRYELNYDAYNSKAGRIYRVNHHSIDYNPRTSPAVKRLTPVPTWFRSALITAPFRPDAGAFG